VNITSVNAGKMREAVTSSTMERGCSYFSKFHCELNATEYC